jgi:hypothetical protein
MHVQTANYIKGNGRPALTLKIKTALAASVMKTSIENMEDFMSDDLISVGLPGDTNTANSKPWPGPAKRIYAFSAVGKIRTLMSDPFSAVVAVDGMMGAQVFSVARKLKLTVLPFSDTLLASYGVRRHQIDLSARGGQVFYRIRAYFVSHL